MLILCDVVLNERTNEQKKIAGKNNTLTYIRNETMLNNHLRLLNRKYTVLIEKFYK